MAVGAITGGLLAYSLRYGIAFFVLTVALWLSYMYGLHKGETGMHYRMSMLLREQVLTPLRDVRDQLRGEELKLSRKTSDSNAT